jgi:1-acyl-sn-glycerol-3-phosphate acyltransferase
VALRFVDQASGEDSLGPLYLGDDTLLSSLWRTLAGPPFVARVRFGEPQEAEDRDRRAWAEELRAAVDALRDDRGTSEKRNAEDAEVTQRTQKNSQ